VTRPALFSESGGLVWHAKALLRHKSLWGDFTKRIDRFLADWRSVLAFGPEPRPTGLILLGPSGGWCLPSEGFVDAFSEVIAVDPDPAARAIFRRRFKPNDTQPAHTGGALSLTWVASTFERVLPALLIRHPHHAVLFCNVLGQLRYQDKKTLERIEFELGQISLTLAGRHWASFHDRISGEAKSANLQELEFFSTSTVTTNELAKRVAKGGEWLDHLTENVLPAQVARRFMAWPIGQERIHWIEAGWVEATPSR
jgi:hypothetical protein